MPKIFRKNKNRYIARDFLVPLTLYKSDAFLRRENKGNAEQEKNEGLILNLFSSSYPFQSYPRALFEEFWGVA